MNTYTRAEPQVALALKGRHDVVQTGREVNTSLRLVQRRDFLLRFPFTMSHGPWSQHPHLAQREDLLLSYLTLLLLSDLVFIEHLLIYR